MTSTNERDSHFFLAGWNGAWRNVNASEHFQNVSKTAPAAVAVRDALLQSEAALEVATARILKADPDHSISVTSEAKALPINKGHDMSNENKVVLPEPVAAESRFTSFSGDRWKWCTVEHAQAFGQDKGYEVRYLYTEQQVRALLATATGLPAHVCKDSTPQLHVGDSSFEGWYAGYVKEGTVSLKQNCRDAYAAGMGDPLVVAAPHQAALNRDARNQLAQLTTQLEAIGAGGVESLRKK